MLKTIRALLFTTVLSCSAIALAAVNVNTANVAELQQLKGIGAKKAADIVAYREANGDFKTVDELTNVKGIGKATWEKLRNELTVETDKENTVATVTKDAVTNDESIAEVAKPVDAAAGNADNKDSDDSTQLKYILNSKKKPQH